MNLRRVVLAALPAPVKRGAKAGLVRARRSVPIRLARTVEHAAGRVLATSAELDDARAARPQPPTEDVRLWVAPANFAGQGHAWARAAARHLGVGARSMNVAGPIRFPTDYEVPAAVYRDLGWQREQRAALQRWTHVLVEAERPVTGRLYGSAGAEAGALEAAGLRVAHITHGSDVRVPSEHVDLHRHSPFTDPADPRVGRLQRVAGPNAAYLRACSRPVFVSTPDILDLLPGATWCPVVVDADAWARDTPVLERRRPRVVHVPSNGWLKGSDLVDPLMNELHDTGVIEYRTLRGLDRAAMLREYGEADIVLDQFVLGLYGVAAAEAMAAGRIVLGYVGESVRAHVRAATGEEIPVVEADPETVVDVLHGLLADRDAARAAAAAGPGFVRRVHDGRLSAAALAGFLGPGAPPRATTGPRPARG